MLYLGPEPFIATLLPFAMAIREPIEVEAPISPQFAYHVQRFQQLYQVWNPDLFQEVPLKTLGYSPPESNPATEAVGLMFSGGVDSFG